MMYIVHMVEVLSGHISQSLTNAECHAIKVPRNFCCSTVFFDSNYL